ncbi:MAG: DUF4258 domain-containing protein [Candidatus Pacearchaeota archaeon]
MEVVYTNHSLSRMEKYGVTKEEVEDCLFSPDSTVESYSRRIVYQKVSGNYVLRVVVEERKEIKRVVTVYRSRRQRYGI